MTETDPGIILPWTSPYTANGIPLMVYITKTETYVAVLAHQVLLQPCHQGNHQEIRPAYLRAYLLRDKML